jgi:hypothetical protein
MDDIVTKLKVALDSLTDAKARSANAYFQYQTAADGLKTAFDSHAPNIKECRSAFVHAQQHAIECHSHMNDITAQSGMLIEDCLSQFEDVEAFWSAQLSEFIGKVAVWLDNLATGLEEGNNGIQQLVRLIPELVSIEHSLDLSGFQQPLADDRFQLLPLDVKLSRILDPKVLFPVEAKKGMLFYRAVKDCPGGGENLPVCQGEVVCCLRGKFDAIIAMNLNESVGVVPLSHLVPVS